MLTAYKYLRARNEAASQKGFSHSLFDMMIPLLLLLTFAPLTVNIFRGLYCSA